MVPHLALDPSIGWAVLAVVFGFVGTFYKFAAETWGWGEWRLFRLAAHKTWLILPFATLGLPLWLGPAAGMGIVVVGCVVGALVVVTFRRFAQAVWLLTPVVIAGHYAIAATDRFDGALLVASAVDMLAR